MNNNLKHLVEQAGISVNIETDHYQKDMPAWINAFSEKLAELIVAECDHIVRTQITDTPSSDSWDRGYDMGLCAVSAQLAQHFKKE